MMNIAFADIDCFFGPLPPLVYVNGQEGVIYVGDCVQKLMSMNITFSSGVNIPETQVIKVTDISGANFQTICKAR